MQTIRFFIKITGTVKYNSIQGSVTGITTFGNRKCFNFSLKFVIQIAFVDTLNFSQGVQERMGMGNMKFTGGYCFRLVVKS